MAHTNPLAFFSRLLVAVLALAASACATTPRVPLSREEELRHLEVACEQGRAGACFEGGNQLSASGDLTQAESAYARACELGLDSGCLEQGRLMMNRGEFAGAEPPLRKAQEDDVVEAYDALATLHDRRGGPGDEGAAARLRWDALAIDKPATEVAVSFRSGISGYSTELTLNVQPMLFLSRRLSLGAQVAFASSGAEESNGFIGYQHFATEWVVPYARLLAGGYHPERESPWRLNAGGEVGVKLCAGPIGHLQFAVGSSRSTPIYASVGLGLNGIIALYALLNLH